MSDSPNTQATLLLNAYFSPPKKDAPKPLTPKEWGKFALWLKDNDLSPAQLLTGEVSDHLKDWSDPKITLDRVHYLLDRGSALAVAMEKWSRVGLWVMTRSDADYPKRLKKRLGMDCPALFFGCGNRKLVNSGGLAVVGSRNITSEDLRFSRDLGRLTADSGYSVVSGGAKGVDENSMLGALGVEGTAVGILADKLHRASTSRKYRPYLLANNLALISPFYPDAGFLVGNAMARNKYIYCLSDAAVVVHSGVKGGTWTGAKENLKKKWVPLWVKKTTDEKAGNSEIVGFGAEWLTDRISEVDVRALLGKLSEQINLQASISAVSEIVEPLIQPETNLLEVADSSNLTPDRNEIDVKFVTGCSNNICEDLTLYEFFLLKLKPMIIDAPKTSAQLAEALEANKTQIEAWLKKAIKETKVRKLSRPVRFEWNSSQQQPLGL